jgi:hypothetical protein
MGSIWMKEGITETTKCLEECVIGFFLEEFEEGWRILCDKGR